MKINIKRLTAMIPSIVFGTSMIGVIPLTLQANALDANTLAGVPILKQDLGTYITITTLGQFDTDPPTGANAMQRVYQLNHIRLITSEVDTTVQGTAKTVTFTAKANSRFYEGFKVLPYTLPVSYSLPEVYGEIESYTFDKPGFPTKDTIFAYLRDHAAHPDQIDEGQLNMAIQYQEDGTYLARITPQPWATWYDQQDGYNWTFIVRDSRVDIRTVIAEGSNITFDSPFVGTPTAFQIVNRIFESEEYAQGLYSKDFLNVKNIYVAKDANVGTATIDGQGFLFGTTTVEFDVQQAPTLAELVKKRDVTPTPNNWYNPSQASVLGSMFNLNPIDQYDYPGLTWDGSQLSFGSFVVNGTSGTATVVANADATSYVPGSSVELIFTINQSIDINTLFVSEAARLVTFESDPSKLDFEQQIYLIQVVLQNFSVVDPSQEANYEKFAADEFNSSCISITWNTNHPYSFTITLNQTAVEFNGSATFYYGIY